MFSVVFEILNVSYLFFWICVHNHNMNTYETCFYRTSLRMSVVIAVTTHPFYFSYFGFLLRNLLPFLTNNRRIRMCIVMLFIYKQILKIGNCEMFDDLSVHKFLHVSSVTSENARKITCSQIVRLWTPLLPYVMFWSKRCNQNQNRFKKW